MVCLEFSVLERGKGLKFNLFAPFSKASSILFENGVSDFYPIDKGPRTPSNRSPNVLNSGN